MSPTQIIAVCVRLFAIWLFLYALSNLLNSNVRSLTPVVLALGFVFIICGLLWRFPSSVARQILPDVPPLQNQNITLDMWFSLGCSLIGIWLLAEAIPALAKYLIVNYYGQKFYPGSFEVNLNWPFVITFHVLHVIFGLWLFLGAKGLKKVFNWARYA